jgi:hypothetical protein
VRAGTIDTDDRGLLWRGGVASVPRTIREIVDARLAQLDPAHRDVIVAGAVVGDFKPALMGAVTRRSRGDRRRGHGVPARHHP